jgi:hypothetical protein
VADDPHEFALKVINLLRIRSKDGVRFKPRNMYKDIISFRISAPVLSFLAGDVGRDTN